MAARKCTAKFWLRAPDDRSVVAQPQTSQVAPPDSPATGIAHGTHRRKLWGLRWNDHCDAKCELDHLFARWVMSRSRARYLGTHGYSLIELMAVMAVVSVLLAIMLPRFAPALERTKVNSAASVLASDLQYAMSLAVRHRKPIAVITQSPQRYVIRERDDPTKVYRTRTLGSDSDFSLDEFTAAPASVYLYPNGVAMPNITYTLGLNGYQRRVRLTQAGQIRISRGP